MKTYLPAIVAVIYFLVSLDHLRSKEYGWALAWLAYSIANVGLILAAKGI